MWELYSALLAGLPRSGCVTRTVPGKRWTLAETDLGGAGCAMSTEGSSIAPRFPHGIEGMRIKVAAEAAKSWNFTEAGLGIAALIILVLSTVTTTFLDAWSAGISCESLSKKLAGKGKWVAVIVTLVGIVASILFPMDDITGFLYLIGSVFAPMIAILITDFFILKKDSFSQSFNWLNLAVWLVGFVIYRCLMTVDIIVGYTLVDMLATMLLCLIANAAQKRLAKK